MGGGEGSEESAISPGSAGPVPGSRGGCGRVTAWHSHTRANQSDLISKMARVEKTLLSLNFRLLARNLFYRRRFCNSLSNRGVGIMVALVVALRRHWHLPNPVS